MPTRLYYLYRDGRKIDGADYLRDVRKLVRYHSRRQGVITVKTFFGEEIDLA